MLSFFTDKLSTPKAQLIATAVVSGATIGSLIFAYQALEREERLTALKNSIPSLQDKNHSSQGVSFNFQK